MKYSRYDLRLQKRKKLFIFLLIILTLAIIFIIIGYKKKDTKVNNNNIIKEDTIIDNEKNEDKNQKSPKVKVEKFYTLQCGVFANKENAMRKKAELESYGYPFIVKNDNKYKVLFGIFDDETYSKGFKMLNSKKQPTARVTYEIEQDCLCNYEIASILNAELQIINKLSETDVKLVKTSELKKWTNSMKDVEKDAININVLNKLRENVNKLANEISKKDIENISISIYQTLQNIRNNLEYNLSMQK